MMRPGSRQQESADTMFDGLFLKNKYDLSAVGRMKLNKRLRYSDNPEDLLPEKKILLMLLEVG